MWHIQYTMLIRAKARNLWAVTWWIAVTGKSLKMNVGGWGCQERLFQEVLAVYWKALILIPVNQQFI